MKGLRAQCNSVLRSFYWRKEIKRGAGDASNGTEESHEILFITSRVCDGCKNGRKDGNYNECKAQRIIVQCSINKIPS